MNVRETNFSIRYTYSESFAASSSSIFHVVFRQRLVLF